MARTGKMQTLVLSWLPPPHVVEQDDQVVHSVYTGHFCVLQVSLSNKFILHGLFLSLLDESPSQLLLLVLSPVPQVLLQEVHLLHSDNSRMKNCIAFQMIRNFCIISFKIIRSQFESFIYLGIFLHYTIPWHWVDHLACNV